MVTCSDLVRELHAHKYDDNLRDDIANMSFVHTDMNPACNVMLSKNNDTLYDTDDNDKDGDVDHDSDRDSDRYDNVNHASNDVTTSDNEYEEEDDQQYVKKRAATLWKLYQKVREFGC